MDELSNYIDGQFCGAHSGATLDNFEPATGRVYGRLPDSDGADVDRAVNAAHAAFAGWRATPARERAATLRRLSALIVANLPSLAKAESIDSGKTITSALQLEIPRAAANFEFFADAITQFSSECHVTDQIAINYTTREPLGVVGCISPWNLPLYLLSWKIAPALAAGNTVVAKPSEMTPKSASLLGQLCGEAGLPAGVLNIVHGTGAKAGAALVEHPLVQAISFTGSTRTGQSIAKSAGPAFKKYSLEMGGKNATLVFADADFAEAVAQTVRAAYSNQGQICLCGSRILVEHSIYARFVAAVAARVHALKIGDPLDANTDQGALVSRAHFEKVVGHLALAKQEGGRFVTGGDVARVGGRCADGWFVAPTLIDGLSPGCRTNQEEIFGPVATIQPFSSDDEALAQANSTRYGLSASVWTKDLSRAHRVAARLQAGIVWVNCWMQRDLRTPFGGVKESGVGREGGLDALRFFTEPKNICVRVDL